VSEEDADETVIINEECGLLKLDISTDHGE
jgi:hypothetical protein